MGEHFLDKVKADILPIFAGAEKCKPKHTFGPYKRNCFLVHFVFNGKGIIKDKYGEHNVSKGQYFLIRPDEVTVYSADEKNPWEYGWIGFEGKGAFPFLKSKTVGNCPLEIRDKIQNLLKEDSPSPNLVSSILHEFISLIFDEDKKDDRLSQIKNYIIYYYMNQLKTSDIAKNFGFERSCLYRAFKKKYGIGVKEFIIQTRMEFAKKFLLEGFTVKQSAYMCGYQDEFNFSKAYDASA